MNSTNHEEDMFKYVGDYTLYDIIGEYYPELSEDYSTENLLSNINPDINISTHDESYNVKKIYTGLIDRLLSDIEKNRNGKASNISEVEIDELYDEFKNISSFSSNNLSKKISDIITDYRRINVDNINEDELNKIQTELQKNIKNKVPEFDTLEEYLKYAKTMTQNDLLRKKVWQSVFQYGDLSNDEREYYRDIAMQIYILAIDQKVKAKYSSEERTDPRNEEYQEYNVLSCLFNPKNRRIYDNFLESNKLNRKNKIRTFDNQISSLKEQQDALREKQDIADRCYATRNFFVYNKIYDELDENTRKKLESGVIKDVLSAKLGDPQKYKTPKEGTYVCKFEEKKPEIIFDEVAEYSDDQVANQRVIGVSYGFFNYGSIISKETNSPTQISAYELELIGVTKKGVDKESTEYVFCKMSDSKVKAIDEVTPTDVVCTNLGKDKKTGKELVIVKTREKLPKDESKYYAKVFFSDLYLDSIVSGYNSYAGCVELQNERYAISDGQNTALEITPIEALKYTEKFPIVCGNKLMYLKDYINSDERNTIQKQLVEERIAGTKEKNNSILDSNNSQAR